MFDSIKNYVLTLIIKDVTKKLSIPTVQKGMALLYVAQNSKDIIEKIKKAIADILQNELAKVLNK